MSRAGKVVLITGAASGMGAEAARLFAAEKASLVLVDINEITQNFENALKIKADLAKDNEVIDLVDKAIKRFGKIDVLLNVAAINGESTLLTTTMDMYDRLMAVNIRGMFHLTKLCAPHLIKTKGCVVNVSSFASMKIQLIYLPYSMTKAAVDYFTRSVALELAPLGVRVNSINPGSIDTPMLPQLNLKADDVAKKIPLGRIGTVTDIAQAMLFLTSDAASYITGTNMVVDGAIRLT